MAVHFRVSAIIVKIGMAHGLLLHNGQRFVDIGILADAYFNPFTYLAFMQVIVGDLLFIYFCIGNDNTHIIPVSYYRMAKCNIFNLTRNGIYFNGVIYLKRFENNDKCSANNVGQYFLRCYANKKSQYAGPCQRRLCNSSETRNGEGNDDATKQKNDKTRDILKKLVRSRIFFFGPAVFSNPIVEKVEANSI